MKQSRNLFFNIFVAMFLITSSAQAEILPFIEPDLTDLSFEETYEHIKSALAIGYRRFDFSRIGKHSNAVKQAVEECKANILVFCAKLDDLQDINQILNVQVGFVWSEVGIGKRKLDVLKRENRILIQGIAQPSVNTIFLQDKTNFPFKLITSSEQVSVDQLLRQALILDALKRRRRAIPFISLPVGDHRYIDMDPAFNKIAQRLNCKPYQVIFALIKQMGFFVIPLISEKVTQELHQEIIQALSLQFLGKDWRDLAHLLTHKSRL